MREWTATVTVSAPSIVGHDLGDDLDPMIDHWLARPGGAASFGHGRINGTCTAFGATIDTAAAYAIGALRESFGALVVDVIAVEVATHEEADRRSDALAAMRRR